MNAPLRSRRGPLAVALVLAVALAAGQTACSRAHLTPTHGRAFREVFVAQDANPNRKTTTSVNGLDSQEAAIIAGSYRKALASKSDPGAGSKQMLMVAPQRAVGESSGLPASVPGSN